MSRSFQLFILVICAAFQGCKTIYAPNAVNTPLFQEGGELKASLTSNNLQAAYSITDHLAVMVNGYANYYKSTDRSIKNKGNGLEAGFGYYKTYPSRLTWEVFAGTGAFNTSHEIGAYKLEVDANKFFVQPGIGWVNRYFEVGVSSRLSRIDYKNITGPGEIPFSMAYIFPEVRANSPYYFWEPALTIRAGYKWIKLQGQVGKVVKLSNTPISFEKDLANVGLIFDVGSWYKK